MMPPSANSLVPTGSGYAVMHRRQLGAASPTLPQPAPTLPPPPLLGRSLLRLEMPPPLGDLALILPPFGHHARVQLGLAQPRLPLFERQPPLGKEELEGGRR